MIESWDSGFCERVGVCAGLFFFCERGVRERDAREACAACRRGFVGGWLLGCRESAKSVFQKSELASLKQRTFEKQRRFPPAKNQHPSCRAVVRQHTPCQLVLPAGRSKQLTGRKLQVIRTNRLNVTSPTP